MPLVHNGPKSVYLKGRDEISYNTQMWGAEVALSLVTYCPVLIYSVESPPDLAKLHFHGVIRRHMNSISILFILIVYIPPSALGLKLANNTTKSSKNTKQDN